MIEYLKVTYYSDEAGASLASSHTIGSECGLRYVILRNIDNVNILKINDSNISHIIEAYKNEVIIGISTNIHIGNPLDNAGIHNLRVKLNDLKPNLAIFKWNGESYNKDLIDVIINLSISMNFTPLIEYEHDHFKSPKIINVDKWLDLLNNSRRLKMLFDPVQYVFRHKIDPVSLVFDELFEHIGMIDVRDHLIGIGPKVIGFGSIDWGKILNKLIADKYTGWLCLEPGLGMRYNELVGKGEVFKAAYHSFCEFLEVSCQSM